MFCKLITLVLSIAATLPLNASGQRDAFREIRENNNLAGSIYAMYDHDIPSRATAPAGYKPFYLSHYGRHGARNIGSANDLEAIYALFSEAEGQDLLTDPGRECWNEVKKVYGSMHGHEGELTLKGVEQQKRIAANTYALAKPVFKGRGKVDAISTTVPRCIHTMNAFCGELQRRNPKLRISMLAEEGTMPVLNPFNVSNPEISPEEAGSNNKKAPWQKDYKKVCKSYLNPDSVFSTLFKSTGFIKKIGKPLSLEQRLFYIAEAAQCADIEGVSLWKYFPEDEICRLWECNSYRFYLSKGPDTLYQKGRQSAFAYKTLEDILTKAEKDIESGEYCARLRFGHDIVVMGLLAVMDIDGYNKPVNEFSEVKNHWRSYDFPMSLNLQFIFYRNRKGDVLVRLLYNERDIKLPIENCGAEYFYRWDDFRNYATERINFARNLIR